MTCCENTLSAEDHKLAALTLVFWCRHDFTYRRAYVKLITISILYTVGIPFLIWFYATLLALLELYVNGH
ncbi:hypothetical protein PsAD13_05435 [Pseudovibrio sp. Ad13]|nr:hypothetical protein PsAD13_05435 [Pseudovibrio sp. Ad13]